MNFKIIFSIFSSLIMFILTFILAFWVSLQISEKSIFDIFAKDKIINALLVFFPITIISLLASITTFKASMKAKSWKLFLSNNQK